MEKNDRRIIADCLNGEEEVITLLKVLLKVRERVACAVFFC